MNFKDSKEVTPWPNPSSGYDLYVLFVIMVIGLGSCNTMSPERTASGDINQGYGYVDAKQTTTAISQIEVNEEDNVSWMELLQKAPGVTVTGSGLNLGIKVRGTKSMNQGQPLFIVDGQPMGNGFHHISFIDPNEVQRISILKDAASAASYGARAADGVILVTMRR